MKKIFFTLAMCAGISAYANENSKLFPNSATRFEIAGIEYKVIPEGYNEVPDPHCDWPEGPVCGTLQIPYGEKQIVEVLVTYDNYPMPPNAEDPKETAEYQLDPKNFSSAEITKIQSVHGYKAVKLAREMYRLQITSVKRDVEVPVYGNCDWEQNCEITGYEKESQRFQQVELVRK